MCMSIDVLQKSGQERWHETYTHRRGGNRITFFMIPIFSWHVQYKSAHL